MTPLKRLLPVLTLLTVSAAASAQPSPPDTALPLDAPARPSLLDSITVQEAARAPEPPMPMSMPPMRMEERSDVVAVRQQITALRLACAAMPAHIYSNIAFPVPPGSRSVPEPIMSRPYAPEEDACAAVLNPDQVGAAYAIQVGVIGASVALFALMFFTLIGGVLRVLWNGPMARAFPMILASRFRG